MHSTASAFLAENHTSFSDLNLMRWRIVFGHLTAEIAVKFSEFLFRNGTRFFEFLS